MNPRESSGVVTAWRAMASPWLIGLASAFLVALGLLHDVARVMHRSADVARRWEVARAHRIADAAAAAAFAAAAPDRLVLRTAGGEGRVRRADGSVSVETRLASGATHCFEGRELPGAPPVAFSRPLSFVTGHRSLPGGVRIDPADVPRLDEAALAAAAAAAGAPWLRREHGLALMHWQAGTDADDFVFTDVAKSADLAAAGDLLVVRGHLWIEPGALPLELRLSRDLVVVVSGNLYLGRSLRVCGAGRLLFVTAASTAACPFVDADGNGRWSESDVLLDRPRFRGPIEGAGNAYCGLRGVAGDIECAAGLLVAGELHLRVDTKLQGPVVLAHGLTPLDANARLQAAGEWRFHPERDRVPGFLTTGDPRPGFLVHRPAAPGSMATMAKQPLYLSDPPR